MDTHQSHTPDAAAPTTSTPEGQVTNQPATASTTTPPVASAHQNRTLMAVLAYFGLLIIIPYLMAKDDPFVHFHIKQGAVLCVIWIAGYVTGMMIWMLMPLVALLNLLLIVLSIVGIVNVIKGKEQELPVVGSFAKELPL